MKLTLIKIKESRSVYVVLFRMSNRNGEWNSWETFTNFEDANEYLSNLYLDRDCIKSVLIKSASIEK